MAVSFRDVNVPEETDATVTGTYIPAPELSSEGRTETLAVAIASE